jgi:putative transposase
LPRIGVVRTKEAATKLLHLLEAEAARLLTATVSEQAGRWCVSFTCEVERKAQRPARPDTTVGVDVGVHHLAVLSTTATVAE